MTGRPSGLMQMIICRRPGILAGTLKVTTLKEGLHSGGAGGIVPSSFRIVRHVLDRLEDSATGRILVDALHVDIPAQRVQQAQVRSPLPPPRWCTWASNPPPDSVLIVAAAAAAGGDEQEVGAFLDKRVYLDLPLVEGASPVHTEPAGTSASGNGRTAGADVR